MKEKCLTCKKEIEEGFMFCEGCWTVNPPVENHGERVETFTSPDNWTNDTIETKTGEKELLTLPKIREITEYDTSFPAGEVLEAHKGVHVHVRTDKGIMDVWVSYKGVREKGNSIRIPPEIKNDVLKVMDRYRYVIMRYWRKQKKRSQQK